MGMPTIMPTSIMNLPMDEQLLIFVFKSSLSSQCINGICLLSTTWYHNQCITRMDTGFTTRDHSGITTQNAADNYFFRQIDFLKLFANGRCVCQYRDLSNLNTALTKWNGSGNLIHKGLLLDNSGYCWYGTYNSINSHFIEEFLFLRIR